ncbi:MAG: S1 RNA-binding domain-containing protein [Chloroflexi bacterium]|nr:S1 RNA-binding domain-containing protein [Chloroflexota bacterium]
MNTTDSAPAGALEPKTKLNGKIVKTTLAGALVDVGNVLPGVIHISQLQKDAVNKVEDVVKEGQVVDVWVRRVKKDRIELTMIEPLGLEWREIHPDMVVKGKIVRIETYGAFVDIGAERPGLVHVSELTRGYVKTPNEVVKEGDDVEAKVLDVDRRKRQIRLSIKALLPEVVEEEKPQREERRERNTYSGGGERGAKRSKPRKQQEEVIEMEAEPVSTEPEMTAMQIAWLQAQNRQKSRNQQQKAKRTKSGLSQESEEIFNRTLEKRLPTGG